FYSFFSLILLSSRSTLFPSRRSSDLVESFAALMAAIGMIVIGSFIVYNSYVGLIHPEEIQQPLLTMVVLAIAGGISLHRAFQMRSIANKYNLLSLKTDAKNSIKDGSASVLGFLSVLI